MMDKKKISIIVLSVFVIISVISVTYALISESLTGTKEVVINVGTLDLVLEEENAITISNALPMYDEVGMKQEDVFKFRLVNKTSNPTNYILKLEEIETGTLDKSDVKYGLIKESVTTIDLVSNIKDGVVDKGVILGNDTIDYELRLWIDSSVTQIKQLKDKFLSFRMNASVKQEIELAYAKNTSELISDTVVLGDNCKTYDDGTDTFLVGQCSNNYVWYSGKLWRVVLKNNETGAIKMVTDNNITSIYYGGGAMFANGYADQWLNQEFLPTLHDSRKYIEYSVWDYTLDNGSIPFKPTGVNTTDKMVGLLSAYEYYTTYNNSEGLAMNSTTYLNNGTSSWLITPAHNIRYEIVWIMDFAGGITSAMADANNLGVRPSVNLKTGIGIVGGTGTKSDPYLLEGDIKEPVDTTTLLNTRYSGEYITFNNELYRIVNVENGLTKITAVDVPLPLSSNMFDGNGSVSFATATIKNDLESYYQDLKLTNETSFNMIEPNTTWYLGTGVNYKASICATVDANRSMNACVEKTTSTIASIGLPRIGEMFTSQITRGVKSSFWMLTPFSDSNIHFVSANVSANNSAPSKSYGARPSMYLKQNVVIASDNTGNGTYEKPYKIELGQ